MALLMIRNKCMHGVPALALNFEGVLCSVPEVAGAGSKGFDDGFFLKPISDLTVNTAGSEGMLLNSLAQHLLYLAASASVCLETAFAFCSVQKR